MLHAVPPSFVRFRASRVFKEGESEVMLECGGTGDPQPTARWSRQPEGVLIPSPDFPNFVSNPVTLPYIIMEACVNV